VYEKRKVNLGTFKLEADLPLKEVINTPFIVLEQAGPFKMSEAAGESLKQYLSRYRGTLIVLCDNGAEGNAFWTGVCDFLKKHKIGIKLT